MKVKVIFFSATACLMLFTMAEGLYFSLEIGALFASTSLLDNIRKPIVLFLYQPIYIWYESFLLSSGILEKAISFDQTGHSLAPDITKEEFCVDNSLLP